MYIVGAALYNEKRDMMDRTGYIQERGIFEHSLVFQVMISSFAAGRLNVW